MPNLYELMGDYKALQEALEDPAADRDAILDALDDAKGELKQKVDAVCRVRANLIGNIATFKTEEGRLSKRRKTLENDKKRLEDWTRETMTVLGVPEIKTDVHSVTVGKGQWTVVVTNESIVPEEFMRVKKDVNREAVLKTYNENGEFVDGTDIVEGTKVLTIR